MINFIWIALATFLMFCEWVFGWHTGIVFWVWVGSLMWYLVAIASTERK